MAEVAGSFGMGIRYTVTSSGAKSTESGFAMSFSYDSRFTGNTNSLSLSVDSPGTFTLNADTPGTLG